MEIVVAPACPRISAISRRTCRRRSFAGKWQRIVRKAFTPFAARLAQQPALSAAQPDLAVLGRQYRAGALRRGPWAADDARLRALDRSLHPALAVCVASSEARLARLAGAPAVDTDAVGDRLCLQQCAVLLGPELHAGA